MKATNRRDKDRRIHKRTLHVSKIKEITLFHSKEQTSKGIGQDLSTGGMNILCTEQVAQGQLLKIAFGLPWDLGVIESEAQVQWVKKEDPNLSVGIKFLKLKPEHLHNIERYIAEAHLSNKKSFLVKFLSFFKK